MEKIEKNNVTIALIVLYAQKKIHPAYVSKHNSNREKEVIPLMIPKGSGCEANKQGRWHYLAVKILSALLRGITFIMGIFIVWIAFILLQHKKIWIS